MPRRARSYLPGLPYHIVQRGNNREACFIEPENYQFYLQLWQELPSRNGVAVHGYCLMTKYVHFLATPDDISSLSKSKNTGRNIISSSIRGRSCSLRSMSFTTV
jgi:putative transposase